MLLIDVVQITADNVDVYNGRLGEEIPSWARRVRFQLIAPDSDWTFSATFGGQEMARDSGPHRCQADNLQSGDWRSPHIEVPIDQKSKDFNILVNVNVVTAGVGLAILQFES